MKCKKCGYIWVYKGKLSLATCPNCFHKTKKKPEDEEKKVTV